MSKKLIVLTSFVLVLSLILANAANAAEKSYLIGWWKFDGDTLDYSGLGNDGTAVGNPTFVRGKVGSNALNLDGDDYVTVDGIADDITDNDITLSAWVKTTGGEPDWFSCNTAGYGNVIRFCIENGKAAFDTDTERALSITTVTDGQWHLLTFVRRRLTGYIYVDGVLENSDRAIYNFSADNLWSIGQEWDGANAPTGFLTGSVDDARIYDRPLSAALVQDLFNGIEPVFVKADNPEPADGSMHPDTWVTLGWSAGDNATSHNVYFGDNFDDVNTGAEGTLLGNRPQTNFIVGSPGFPYPRGFIPGTIYYWRIDEVEADGTTIHKGDLWSFTTPPAKAYNPEPADNAKFVSLDVTLSWTAGIGARSHTVYLGDNFDDVDAGTRGTYKGSMEATSYIPGPAPIVKDTVYYWRVDKFDGSATHKGNVWSFKTLHDIPITDPNLLGWWKLDNEGSGAVVDSSGFDHHGTLRGDPQWVDGYDGGALEFDGSGDYVNIDGYKGILAADGVQHEFTVAAWIKTTAEGEIITWGTNTSTQRMTFRLHDGRIRVEHGNGNMRGEANVNDNEWHHIAAVVPQDGAIKDLTFYLDGEVDEYRTILNPDNKFNLTGTADVSIGRRATSDDRYFTGLIDDVRIYDKELSQQEIKQVMRTDPLLAWDPSPAHRKKDVPHNVILSWISGDNAVQHDVYVAADEQAVTDADTSDTTGIYRPRQSLNRYTLPETLEFNQNYYWRIDEYNTDGTISKGRIWSFTAAGFLLIDDFEEYNDYEPDRIFDMWKDGWGIPINGSIVGYPRPNFAEGEHYVETEIVHSGKQSMPYFYDNNFKYSEATMTLTYPRDWTEKNVNILTLWFRGDSSNTAAPMYAALNGSVVLYHDNPNVSQIETWTEWNIDLKTFVNQGINLTDVDTIAVGFGDKNNLQAGGSGAVFFDDIRLYRIEPEPRPKPEPAP